MAEGWRVRTEVVWAAAVTPRMSPAEAPMLLRFPIRQPGAIRRAGLVLLLVMTLTGCPRPASPDRSEAPLPAETPSATVVREPVRFEIAERFGVSHPDQIIDFELPSGTETTGRLVEVSSGVSVPFQLLEGGSKLAVQTSLEAGATRAWEFHPGGSATAGVPANAVRVEESSQGIEISNGLAGVRIPVPGTGTPPAPIQAFWMGTGWSADQPNPLKGISGSAQWTVEFLEKGPLVTTVRVSYSATGGAFYNSTLTLQAGQPSVVIEEEANGLVSYELDFPDNVVPTHARYRGLGSSGIETGYYPATKSHLPLPRGRLSDHQVDLRYTKRMDYPQVVPWNRWAHNTGWYWQMFDANGGPQSPVVGVFAARASRQVRSNGSGINAFVEPGNVSDATALVGPDGMVHLLSVEGGRLIWRGIHPGGRADEAVVLGEGLEAPSATFDAQSRLCIAAYQPETKQFVLGKMTGPTPPNWSPITWSGEKNVVIAEPVPHLVGCDSGLSLFFPGKRLGSAGGVLLSEKGEEFLLAQMLPRLTHDRAFNGPMFGVHPTLGPILLAEVGDSVKLLSFPGGAISSPPEVAAMAANGRPQGLALNAGEGWAAVRDREGRVTLFDAAGNARSPSGATVPKQTEPKTGPNRSTFAVEPGGKHGALIFCGDPASGTESRILQFHDGACSDWQEANNLSLARPQVLWIDQTKEFLLVGWKDGVLSTYAAKPGSGHLVQQTSDPGPSGNRAGFRMTLDGTGREKARFQWGLFCAPQSSGLADPEQHQPINLQHNLHGGINLNKLHRLPFDFPAPEEGFGSPFLAQKQIDRLKQSVRENPGGAALGLMNAEPEFKTVMEMWADPTGTKASAIAKRIGEETTTRLNKYVNGNGIHDMEGYWHGSLAATRLIPVIDQLLVEGVLSDADRKKMIEISVLNGAILFDNDFVPMDNSEGVNLGTRNMPLQYGGSLQSYALFLSSHPMMADRVGKAVDQAKEIVARSISENGVHQGGLHYIGASAGPLFALLQQMQKLGIYDAFRDNPRLRKFAEFYLQTLTPPDIRFSMPLRPRAVSPGSGEASSPPTRPQVFTPRFLPAIGDGNTERTEFLGLLGTGFANVDPSLSRRLMWGWDAMGRVHSGFHASTVLRIDESLPAEDPHLRSAAFPGYFSVLRSEWGTPLENAIWIVNGNFYIDHAHNDLGTVILYLLGCPVSLDWGSFYTPGSSGGVMHSTVIQEKSFGQQWDKQIDDTKSGTGFSRHYGDQSVGEATSLDVLPDGSRAVSTVRACSADGGTTWVRTVSLVNLDPERPVVLIQDRFSGPGADQPKIWTMNFMAAGPVQTPVGPLMPDLRMCLRNDLPKEKGNPDPDPRLPSGGPVFHLPAGVNALGFTGESWKGHPSGGIDWNLYVIPDEPQEALIGNWAVESGADPAAFKAAQGRNYEERQHILRLRGTGSFTSVLVPWQKGSKPSRLDVRKEGADIVVQRDGKTVRFASDGKWSR